METALCGVGPGWELVVAERENIDGLLPGWTWERAHLGQLVDRQRLEAALVELGDIRLLGEQILRRLPEELAEEIDRARLRHPIFVAFVEAKPVTFAYAPCRTETLFDIAVDTLLPYRQQGHARRCAAALIAAEMRGARMPVWGAVEHNLGSQRLGESLGFAFT